MNSVQSLIISLENLSKDIKDRIESIKSGARSVNELETAHRETKRLLSNYDAEIKKCSAYVDLCPELDISHHRSTYTRLLSSEHQAVLLARSKLQTVLSPRDQLFSHTTTQPSDSLAQDITDSLSRLTRTMQDELLRSEASFEIMAQSTKRMEATAESYTVFGGVLTTSKRLIVGLWRRERTDRMMIFGALGVYLAVLLYVASKRLWFPRFIFPWIYRLISFLFGLVMPNAKQTAMKSMDVVGTMGAVKTMSAVETMSVIETMDVIASASASSSITEVLGMSTPTITEPVENEPESTKTVDHQEL